MKQEVEKQETTSTCNYAVQIFDLSSDQEDKVVETIKGFYNLEHANAFAKAYVRDSVERCRIPGASTEEIFESWSAFGEDAKVINAEENKGWSSTDSVMMFIENKATPMEKNWRKLDPRRLVEEDEFFEEDEE